MFEDTIIAVSTPLGFGGIGIVRLSGKKALEISRTFFRPRKSGAAISPRRPIFGTLLHPETGQSFEEAFLTYFPSPQTYTKEDIVEISGHGSPIILEEIVRIGVSMGARAADPGEFTLRAYLNGRIDILQAEAVSDIIQAASMDQAGISFRQLKGRLSQNISAIRNQIIRLISRIEAAIEFPDEELGISSSQIRKTLGQTRNYIVKLIESYDIGRILKDGPTLAIVGRTNTGKSTLFNALLENQRAITSPHPGTTRDYLRERLIIHGAAFNLIDTAGWNSPSHPVEIEGIRRSREMASAADGILLLLDSSRKITEKDHALIRKFHSRPLLVLLNKSDLPCQSDLQNLRENFSSVSFLEISALTGSGLPEMMDQIFQRFFKKPEGEQEIIFHLRQKLLLEDMRTHLDKAEKLLEEGHSEDFYVEEIRKILPIVGRLTGEIQAEDVLKEIFGRFCVGK